MSETFSFNQLSLLAESLFSKQKQHDHFHGVVLQNAPSARTAFCATSTSVSCESRLSASMAAMPGLLTFSIATASGTARLHMARSANKESISLLHQEHITTYKIFISCPHNNERNSFCSQKHGFLHTQRN